VAQASDPELQRKSVQQFFELKRKVTQTVQQIGLEGQKAQVALALDISASMSEFFHRGIVQQVVERILALSVKFDDNGAIDIFLFGARDYSVGELQEADFFGYVDRVIRPSYSLEGATRYAGVIQRIVEHYAKPENQISKPDPAYVLFVTDGDNNDHKETEQALISASSKPIFWQFVGIGKSNFQFLQRLDTMPGRHIDNANFFQINDVANIDDMELYGRLLGEFPSWLSLAKEHRILASAQL
jgi:hypothetical protein